MNKARFLTLLLLFAVLLTLLTELIITDRSVRSISREQDSGAVSLLEEAQLTYTDYDDFYYSLPKFLPRTEEPEGLLCFDFSKTVIGSVKILFEAPMTADGFITLNYANVPANAERNQFSPFSTMRMAYSAGDTEFMASLPVKEYSHFDIHTDEKAAVAEVFVSPLPLAVAKRTFSVVEALVLFAVYAAMLCVPVLAIPKAYEAVSVGVKAVRGWFSARYKRILKTAAVLIVCVGAAFAMELFTGLFGSYFTPQRAVFWGGLVFMTAELWLWRKECLEKPENTFLLLSLALGGVIAFTGLNFPTSFDADMHYENALRSSYMFSGEAVVTQADAHMIHNGEAYYDPDTDDGRALLFRTDRNLVFLQEGRQALDAAYRSGNYYTVDTSWDIGKLVYIPYGVTLTLGRIMRLPFRTLYDFGKLGSVLVYSLMMYAAAKRLTSRKMLFIIMALLPMPLYLAGNYSYDYLIIAGISLGFVYFIEEYKNPGQPLSIKSGIIMLLSFFIGISPKPVYFPLLLLPLLLPKSKFPEKKQRLVFSLLTIAAILILIVLMFTSVSGGVTDLRGGDNVNSGGQVRYVLTHIPEYLKVLANHIISSIGFDFFLYCYFDWKMFGVASSGIVLITALLLGFLILVEPDDADSFHVSRCQQITLRTSIALLSAATSVLVISAMYAVFNNVGSKLIIGVQPRYFIPLFFPLTYLIQKTAVEKKNIRHLNTVLFSVTVFINYFVLFKLVMENIIS